MVLKVWWLQWRQEVGNNLMIIHPYWDPGQKVSRCSCFNISPSPPKKTPISSKVVLLDPIMINNDHHHSFSNFVDHDHHLHHHWLSFQLWIFSIWLKSWFLKKSFSNTVWVWVWTHLQDLRGMADWIISFHHNITLSLMICVGWIMD